ncbi:MAG: hypothetical protein HQK51_14840 [Oligoflexia bacterium]|nr:hypothetical protein [Oligoflexia bacterium]
MPPAYAAPEEMHAKIHFSSASFLAQKMVEEERTVIILSMILRFKICGLKYESILCIL